MNSTIKEQQQQQQNQQQRHGVFKQDDVFWPFETVKPKLSYTFFNSWFLAQREREREREREWGWGGDSFRNETLLQAPTNKSDSSVDK